MTRIEIIQWREPFDDEDCLTVQAFGADDDQDAVAFVAECNDLTVVEDAADIGNILVTNSFTLTDGDVIEATDGREYRVTFTEVTTK